MSLVKRVKDRSVEEGDCWIWQGCMNGTIPQMHITGRKVGGVRIYLWRELHGQVPKGKVVSNSCGDDRCVNPDHLILMTPSQRGKRAAKQGKFSTLSRRIRLAHTKRETQSKLDWDSVRVIREGSDTLKTLSERFGVSIQTVSKVRRGERWADLTNPFAALGAA